MFYLNANTKPADSEAIADRARSAGAAANKTAQSAAQSAQAAAQAGMAAAHDMSETVRQRVQSARGWTAPRLENAADYTTRTVAPRVSTAIRGVAKQVGPDQKRPTWRSALSWGLLGLAAAAAIGAAAVLIRQRYQAAIDADSDVVDVEDADERGNADGKASAADGAGVIPDQAPTADVNGHVSSSGW
ncbi:MAG TPA: hypothetical protein VHZ03_50480 [Trebonia sp.]|jgi:hypothetical protein|nr:hypothetical protein [Trebonia sp.]